MYSTLLFDLADGIARVTVNRPDKLNALNATVIDELAKVADASRNRPGNPGRDTYGAGGKAFVAGADIAELAARGRWMARPARSRGSG